jgi:UDP-2,3-diacylglucosamine pyrophosphatase LpxH
MLIVLSDIHLMDETTGKHNPAFSSFENVFFPHIIALAKSKDVKEIKLLLLGDTFDILRSEQWLYDELIDRPWGEHGLADVVQPRVGSKTEARTLKILGQLPEGDFKTDEQPPSILFKNWKILEFLRTFKTRVHAELKAEIPVEIIFVPGNHDRLANVYPRVRDEIAKILNIELSHDNVEMRENGDWWFRTFYMNEAYGIFARHGQQFDMWNYGGGEDYSYEGAKQVPIGDVLGTEFATKLAFLLKQMQMDNPFLKDELIEAMKDLGLVRPFTLGMEWLHQRIRTQENTETREVLNRIFNEVLGDLLRIEFVRRWHTPNTRLDNVVRAVSRRWLRWIPDQLLKRLDSEDLLPFFANIGAHPADPDRDKHLLAAYNERIWRENPAIRFIVYGHTHYPAQRALDGEGGREVFYLNTGSWRENIFKTLGIDAEHDFIKLKALTYTIFYRGDEDLEDKTPGTPSFEVWTGTKKKF